ncbi:MAG: trypsin-like peptidase domain-containing protein [Candidatus Paceibacterota bacterium]
MDQIVFSKFLLENTYLVNVFQNNELVSQGSAFPINSNGDLITAAHVITGRLPYKPKDVQNLTILCRKPGDPFDNYTCNLLAPNFSLPQLKDPIFIDAAILVNQNRGKNVSFFKTSDSNIEEGRNVLMCGYSDEVDFPLSFNKNIDLTHPDFKGAEEGIKFAFEAWMKLNMVKSGMIGRAFKINIKNLNNITGYSIYIDNGIHSGASGGPVINAEKEVIGIITQRAITSYSTSKNPGLSVPSGSTIAISPNLILEAANIKGIKL